MLKLTEAPVHNSLIEGCGPSENKLQKPEACCCCWWWSSWQRQEAVELPTVSNTPWSDYIALHSNCGPILLLKCVYLNGDWQIYMTHTHSPIIALCGYPHYHCPHFEAVSLFQTKYFSEYLCWASLSICICGTSWPSFKAHDLRHLHRRACIWYDSSWSPECEHKVIYLCVEFQLSQTQVFCQ